MWGRKIIALSDYAGLGEDFLPHLSCLGRAGLDALILREPQLDPAEYLDLAREVLKICARHRVSCFLHHFTQLCLRLGHKNFHAPLPLLREDSRLRRYFDILGSSVHSREELLEAMHYRVSYVLAGHIFESASKPGLTPRGLGFLRELLAFSTLPLYAIGGVRLERIAEFANLDLAGSAGANFAGVALREALMSPANQAQLKNYLKECKEKLAQL